MVHQARPRRGRARARSRLGADGHLLRVPARALEASADLEPGGVALRSGPTAYRRGEALQEGGECVGRDLEDAAHRREDLPATRRARAARRCRERRRLRQRSTCCEPRRAEGRRLISFTHFLTRPPPRRKTDALRLTKESAASPRPTSRKAQ